MRMQRRKMWKPFSGFYLLANECRVAIADGNSAGLPVGAQQVFLPEGLESSMVLFKLAVCHWSLAPFVGLLCLLTHWLFIRPPEPKA